MSWYDIFSSKEEVARELAEREVSTISNDLSESERAELVECAQMYIEDTYDKDIIADYLDAYHR